jgi:hypothetical protein
LPFAQALREAFAFVATLAVATILASAGAQAQDWTGAFTLIPVSAPDLVLEAVLPGRAEGNVVSIGRPTGADNQVWVVTRKEGNTYALGLKANPGLVLAAKAGGTNNGTPMIIETDGSKPWQRWTIKANASGAFSLLVAHAPTKGLDDLGGGATPGSRQDLWDYHPGDEHLEWVLKPLAGATVPAEFVARRFDPFAPKGTIKEFSFSESRIFPGTRRGGSVFIPAQYDPARPACVYVRQDGYNAAEERFLESLIAAGDMPVTVGVFVRPGEVLAPRPGTLGRRTAASSTTPWATPTPGSSSRNCCPTSPGSSTSGCPPTETTAALPAAAAAASRPGTGPTRSPGSTPTAAASWPSAAGTNSRPSSASSSRSRSAPTSPPARTTW